VKGNGNKAITIAKLSDKTPIEINVLNLKEKYTP
jgi:hypothetical protein